MNPFIDRTVRNGTYIACLFGAMESTAKANEVRCDSFVNPLTGNVEVRVNATDILDVGDELRVFQGQTDITSSVVQSASLITATDTDLDGIYESYSRSYDLDLSSLEFDSPTLILEATTFDEQSTPSTTTRAITMIAPVEIGTPVTSWISSLHGNEATFYVRIQGVNLTSKSIVVLMNDQDVTSNAVVTEQIVWDHTRQGLVNDRLYAIGVDLTSIQFGQTGDTLQLRVDVSFVKDLINALISFFSNTVTEVPPAPELTKCQCVANAVQAFVTAANISVSSGTTTVGASLDDVADAGSDLADSLKACEQKGSKTVTISGIGTVVVGIGTVSGAAPLVISVGADGEDNLAGGNASATNREPGGASVAIGGEGGAEGPTNGGTGTSSSIGGDAVSTGGTGGAGSSGGGPGGAAKAENKGDGTAKAKGGDGGDPPGSGVSGGNGGAATGTSPGSTITVDGGPGGGGSYGTGGTVTAGPDGASGTKGTGNH